MGYIGYIECDSCPKFVYINDPAEIKIWLHPDDPLALAEVVCKNCGGKVQSRIPRDHLSNFQHRGCVISEWNDRFSDSPLTDEDIDNWDEVAIEAELAGF